MYLCCVESLSLFQSKLDFLRILKVAQKSGQRPCIVARARTLVLSLFIIIEN